MLRVRSELLLLLVLAGTAPVLQSQDGPQQLVVPYWTTEPGWNTRIEIRNNRRDRAITVQPVLRLASGARISLPAISVDPAEAKPIDLGLALATITATNAQAAPMFGSAVLQFTGNSPANVFAAAIVRLLGAPIAFHFDALAGDQTSIAGTRETLWVLPTASANTYVFATNTSTESSDIRFTVSQSTNYSVSIVKTVAPGQSVRVSVREALPDLPGNALGSVSVSTPNANPDFAVIAFAYDETSGFSAVSRVFERDPNGEMGQITMRAPMLALRQPSPSLSFPSGTELQPRVLLRNASADAIAPLVTIVWKAPDATGVSTVNMQPIQPGQLRVASLNDDATPAIPENANWAGVSVTYVGRLGDVVPITASYDQTGRYGTQTPFSPTVAAVWEGGMWHAGTATTNTVLTVGNGGTEATTALVTLHFNGGKQQYEIQERLRSGEQAWIDIGQLIQTQAPDTKGTTIPPDVMEGTYSIRDLTHRAYGYLFEGKINIDRTFGHAMYGCARCCGEFPPFMVPSSSTIAVGDVAFQQQIHATDSCWGNDVDETGDGYNWNSSNSSIAAVSGTGLVNGLAAGTATITSTVQYTASYAYCPQRIATPQSTVNVKPTISGPNTVWWFNGQTVPGFPTQITLSTQAPGTWNVTAGANEVHLSSNSGASVTVTGTGTFSQTLNDVQITVTVNGMTSDPFSLSSNGAKSISRSSKIDFPCSGTGLQGWDTQINYTLRDNFNNAMGSVPVNEGFGGTAVWPQPVSTGGTTTTTGTFTDDITVCASPGSLNPMPISPQQPETTTIVDSFGQTWCAGITVSNPWGSACQGAQVQSGTMKRFLDHGDVTVP
jgi:hypothetical protein